MSLGINEVTTGARQSPAQYQESTETAAGKVPLRRFKDGGGPEDRTVWRNVTF